MRFAVYLPVANPHRAFYLGRTRAVYGCSLFRGAFPHFWMHTTQLRLVHLLRATASTRPLNAGLYGLVRFNTPPHNAHYLRFFGCACALLLVTSRLFGLDHATAAFRVVVPLAHALVCLSTHVAACAFGCMSANGAHRTLRSRALCGLRSLICTWNAPFGCSDVCVRCATLRFDRIATILHTIAARRTTLHARDAQS